MLGYSALDVLNRFTPTDLADVNEVITRLEMDTKMKLVQQLGVFWPGVNEPPPARY